jgi:hypothetical protein
MTPSEINRAMAEKVMGAPNPFSTWVLKGDDWYILPAGVPAYWELYVYFDPYHRWDHAAMGLEKFTHWKLDRFGQTYSCKILINPYWTDDIEADTAHAAICLACLEAVKEIRVKP